MSNNCDSSQKKINEKHVGKVFKEIVEDLYLAEKHIKRAVDHFMRVENNHGAQGLKEILERMGSGGKSALVEKVSDIMISSNDLKSIVITHKITQKSGRKKRRGKQ